MEEVRARRRALSGAPVAMILAAVALPLAACAGGGLRERPGFGVRIEAAPGAGRVAVPGGTLDVADVVLVHRGESPATVRSLAIDGGAPEADPLRRLVPRARPLQRGERALLAPGGRTVVLAERLTGGAPPPAPLGVTIALRGTNEHGFETDGEVRGATSADFRGAVTVGPPLAGGGWVAENGPSTCSGHRRALIWKDGRPRCAQRFAIDFFRELSPGRTHDPSRRGNEAYGAWDGLVVAPADAVVASAVDGIPDNEPDPSARAVEMNEATIAGNHVVLDLGGGAFAMLAHLRQGTVRVRAGDRVRRGELLGRVGNSGNSTEPHLHLHVADGPSPVDADGVPFVLDAFASGGGQFSGVLPAEGSVVDFPAISPSADAPKADAAR